MERKLRASGMKGKSNAEHLRGRQQGRYVRIVDEFCIFRLNYSSIGETLFPAPLPNSIVAEDTAGGVANGQSGPLLDSPSYWSAGPGPGIL